MELDHVFLLTHPDGPDLPYLRALGLTETYRRRHPGQGTENICFCFDNIFLECLWITSVAEAGSAPIARTALHQRSQWRTLGTSPFGLAWRQGPAGPPPGIPAWQFTPPYLPPGRSIAVATDSDDPRQPLIFASPGATPPAQWPAERRGLLQQPAGLGAVLSVVLEYPQSAPPAPALLALASATILRLAPARSAAPAITLLVERNAPPTPLRITLPRPLV